MHHRPAGRATRACGLPSAAQEARGQVGEARGEQRGRAERGAVPAGVQRVPRVQGVVRAGGHAAHERVPLGRQHRRGVPSGAREGQDAAHQAAYGGRTARHHWPARGVLRVQRPAALHPRGRQESAEGRQSSAQGGQNCRWYK